MVRRETKQTSARMTRSTPIIFILPLMLLAAGACVADSKPASENQSTVVATQVEASLFLL